jgi:hypothetical protein
MIYGHLTFHSKNQAREDLCIRKHQFVWCPECFQVEELSIRNRCFDDDFGGVSDYRVTTECGNDPDDCVDGCSGCGELEKDMVLHQVMYNRMIPKQKDWKDDWYCDSCYKEYLAELVV